MVDATLPTVAFIVANARRRPADRHLGGARRGAPGLRAPAGAPGERPAGGQRAVRRRRRRRHRRGLRPGPRLLRPRHRAQRRDRRRAARLDRRAPAAGRAWSPSSSRPATSARWPAHSLPGLRGRIDRARAALHHACRASRRSTRTAPRPDPEPERHWREDPRLLRAYSWLTVLWGVTFLLRVAGAGAALPGRTTSRCSAPCRSCSGCRSPPSSVVVTLWVVVPAAPAPLRRRPAEPPAVSARPPERPGGRSAAARGRAPT